MRKLLILTLAISIVSPAFAQGDAKTSIRAMLLAQVEAWNHHDLEGFMSGYWHSPGLTFFSATSVVRGWEPTLKRYREKYQSQGKEMGKLDFFDLEVTSLAPDSAFVRGHWHLQFKDAKETGGLFTLIVRRFPDGWKIVHDHTS